MAIVDAACDPDEDSISDPEEFKKKGGSGGLLAFSFPSATKSLVEPKEWQYSVDVVSKRYATPGLCNPPTHGIPVWGCYRTARDVQMQG